MSSLGMFGFGFLYVIPIALLALLLTTRRRRPPFQVGVILATLPLFYIGHYAMLQAIQGWPSNAELPERFQLLAFDVSEPDRNADRGEILLWVRDTSGGQPRAHRLAYSRELHETLLAANRLEATGNPQVGTRTTRQQAAEEGETPRERDAIRFEPAPRQSLPAKQDDT